MECGSKERLFFYTSRSHCDTHSVKMEIIKCFALGGFWLYYCQMFNGSYPGELQKVLIYIFFYLLFIFLAKNYLICVLLKFFLSANQFSHFQLKFASLHVYTRDLKNYEFQLDIII